MDNGSYKIFFQIINYTDKKINDIFKKYNKDESGLLTEENIYQ